MPLSAEPVKIEKQNYSNMYDNQKNIKKYDKLGRTNCIGSAIRHFIFFSNFLSKVSKVIS